MRNIPILSKINWIGSWVCGNIKADNNIIVLRRRKIEQLLGRVKIINSNEGEKFNFGKIKAVTKLDKLSIDTIISAVSTKEGSLYQGNLIWESIS